MNLALFVRAVVILVPVAVAQRCEVADYASYTKRPHRDTSVEARHQPARISGSASCGAGDPAGCLSFLELTHGRDPG